MKLLQRKQVGIATAAVAAVLIGLSVAAFLNVGSWLIVSDALPDHVDVVFTFASENQRVVFSKELMARFAQAHWVLSDYRDGQARILRRDGFDMSRVTPIDTCSSTLGEVEALDLWLRRRTTAIAPPHTDNVVSTLQRLPSDRPLSVALVSSPYHMRRIRFMVNSTFHDRDLEFHYIAVPLERYKWDASTFRRWWTSRAISSIVISELQKIVYFWLVS